MAAVLGAVHANFAPAFVLDVEHQGDVAARERLLDQAMGRNRRRKSSEKLRRGRLPSEGLAFVARDDSGRVIGTVRLWDIEAGIDTRGTPVKALLLGPLAVDPAHEGKGIGGALMRHAIMDAKMRGHGAILLVGDAAYYERFGFFADKTQHLVMPGPFERARFLSLELVEGWLDGAAGMLTAAGRKLPVQALRKAA